MRFDEENISELQANGEVEETATLKMEVVSKDKRCMKTRLREKPLVDYSPPEFTKTIPQRLFTPDDVIQIQITNTFTKSHCIQLKPIDLPLSLSGAYIHYVQIGNSSQLKVAVELRQSEKLLKEVEEQLATQYLEQGYKGEKKEVAALSAEAEKKRREEVVAAVDKEHNESVAFLKDAGVGLPEKVNRIKKLLHQRRQENKERQSKANRLKAEAEKLFAHKAKAEAFKSPPKAKPKPPKEENLFAELSAGPLGGATSGSASAKKDKAPSLCRCGAFDPEYKGYCGDCVKKLKSKFDYLIEKFNKLKAEYDEYNQADLSKADEKLKILKNKMAQYGAVDVSMIDVMSKHEKLINSEENRAFAEFKVSVTSLR